MVETPSAASYTGLALNAARRRLIPVLAAHGIEDPEREARLLIEIATGLAPERILLEAARALTPDEAGALSRAIERRCSDEPISRIRGSREFYGRTFQVTPDVLDPRPDTETVVDQVLQWSDETGGRSEPLRILDVGTGSGCLLVTLLAELPAATGLGTDISPAALEVARANAERHGVAERARFALHRSLDGIEGPFDVLVSNPPYIPSGQIAGLEPGVRKFDPLSALDGGPDGLAVYRELAQAAAAIVSSGWIVLEVGAGQDEDVARLFQDALGARVKRIVVKPDLGGHRRCVALLTHS